MAWLQSALRMALGAGVWIATLALPSQTPMQILDAQSVTGYGAGWDVDPKNGYLNMRFPVGTLGGDIPVPVVLRYNATHQLSIETVQPPSGSPYQVAVDRPAQATLHFGYITAANQVVDGRVLQQRFVLEDGSQTYWGDDFTGWFFHPTSFGLASVGSAVRKRMTPDRRLVLYSTDLSGLGSAAAHLGSALGFGSVVQSYQVLVDQDRARVYQFLTPLNAWVPVLWLDRFQHFVTFDWARHVGASGTVDAVVAKNHLGKGVCIQWLVGAPSDTATEQGLLRVDWINVQAPGLYVTGYPSVSLNRPSGIGTTAPAVLPVMDAPFFQGRPTQIRLGNPSGLPSWPTFSALPTLNEVPWADEIQWSFTYDTGQTQIDTFTDTAGVSTRFDYAGGSCFPDSGAGVYFCGVGNATGTASQPAVTLYQHWSRVIPNWDQPSSPWTATHTKQFSPGAGSGQSVQYTFAGPSAQQEYRAGAIKKIVLNDNGQAWSTTEFHYSHGGTDGTVLTLDSQTVTRKDEPVQEISRVLDANGFPTEETTKVGGKTTEKRAYTWEAFTNKLVVGRLKDQTTTRYTEGGAALTPVVKKITYYANGLPQDQYQDAGTLKMGSTLSYDPKGHVTGVAPYLAGVSGAPSQTVHTTDDGWPDLITTSGGGISLQQSLDYTSMGAPRSMTDAAGITTTQDVDSRGRVTGVQRPGTPTQTIEYTGERQRTLKQDGKSAIESYDGFGRMTDRTRLDGVQEHYTYDSRGRVGEIKETADGSVRTRAMDFDPLDRLTFASISGQPSVSYGYNTVGRNLVISATSSAGTTTTTKDPWGQVLEYKDVLDRATTAEYNELGLATTVVQGAQTRSFSYNRLGFLLEKTEPETGTTKFENHNGMGQPQTIVEEGGRTRTLVYDGVGRLLSQTNGSDSVSFTYGGFSNAFLMTATSAGLNGTVTQDFQYTNNGYQLSQEKTTFNGQVFITNLTNDGSGRLTELEYPSGLWAKYEYSNGVLNTVKVKGPTIGTNYRVLAALGINSWGNLTGLTFYSGAKSEWGFDPIGASLGSWKATPLGGGTEERIYSRDTKGNLQSITPDWTTLQHDAVGRVEKATGFGFTNNFVHDVFDNNVSSVSTGSVPLTMNNFTFANPLPNVGGKPSNRLPGTQLNGGVTGWDYTLRGEATALGTGVSTNKFLYPLWDGLGRLYHVGGDVAIQDYLYAPSGMRVQVLDSSDATRNRRFAYTSGGMLLSEYGPAQAGRGSAKAVRVAHKTGTASALSRCLGGFAAGATVQASVWFKAPVGVSGAMALHDGRVGDPQDNKKFASLVGNGGWQQLSLTMTLSRADTLWIHLFGDMFTPTSATTTDAQGVVYDDVQVRLGAALIMAEDFESGLATTTNPSSLYGWYGCGQANDLLGTSTAPDTWRRDVVYAGGLAIAEIDAEGIHELHSDHLGSPRIVTAGMTGMAKPMGQVEGRQAFASYGERLPNEASGYQPLTGYTGHLQQDATGLIYMRGRYYSPAWHRFLNSDQGVDPNQFNQFAYVGGSPLQFTDPSGLSRGTVTCLDGRKIQFEYDPSDSDEEKQRKANAECGGGSSGTVTVWGGGWVSGTTIYSGSPLAGPSPEILQLRKTPQTPTQKDVPCEVRKAMMASVAASNKTGIHEEGGLWGTSLSGNLLISPAVPGPPWQQGQTSVSIDVTNAANPSLLQQIGSFSGSWHVHPRGNSRVQFNQFPSNTDKSNQNLAYLPINIVLGAGDRQVYFYNSSGVINQMGFGAFMDGCK